MCNFRTEARQNVSTSKIVGGFRKQGGVEVKGYSMINKYVPFTFEILLLFCRIHRPKGCVGCDAFYPPRTQTQRKHIFPSGFEYFVVHDNKADNDKDLCANAALRKVDIKLVVMRTHTIKNMGGVPRSLLFINE